MNESMKFENVFNAMTSNVSICESCANNKKCKDKKKRNANGIITVGCKRYKKDKQ